MTLARRVYKALSYACAMAKHSRHHRVEPVRRPGWLEEWTGMWVAVKDDKVIAAAYNARDLVPQVRSKGETGRGAVAQYVPKYSDDIVIGVG